MQRPSARKFDRTTLESLQHVEHRAVVVVEEPAGNVNDIVGRDADKILIEGSMVNRAEAQSVRNLGRSSRLGISDDVRSVQQANFLQPARDPRLSRPVRDLHGGSSAVTKHG
jgi:hypothetical protein